MYGKRGRALRQCQAITLNGFGRQCSNFSKVGFNLCSIHLVADDRVYPDRGERAFNKLMGRRQKPQRIVCRCQAFPFPHQAGSGVYCNWPMQPTKRLECKSNKEAQLFRKKLRRQGIVVNALREIASKGPNPSSKVVDLDSDPNDLSMEQEYLSKREYAVDVLSLPIEERRAIQKQRLIAEYLLQVGKADIDSIDGVDLADSDNAKGDCDSVVEDTDDDLVEIDGKLYRLK